MHIPNMSKFYVYKNVTYITSSSLQQLTVTELMQ